MPNIVTVVGTIGFLLLCQLSWAVDRNSIERIASQFANNSMTQILGKRVYSLSDTGSDYTEYIAEDVFWRLVTMSPNYDYFVFSMVLRKEWEGWYTVHFFNTDYEDFLGHSMFEDKHFRATTIIFGFYKGQASQQKKTLNSTQKSLNEVAVYDAIGSLMAGKNEYDHENVEQLLSQLKKAITERFMQSISGVRTDMMLLLMKNDNQARMLYSLGKPFTNLDSSLYSLLNWNNRAYKIVVYFAMHPSRS